MSGTEPNTQIHYTYRDAANYKQGATAVLAGRLSDDDLQAALAARDEGGYFIPSQVGLADLQHRFGGVNTDDHVWHELEDDGITVTDATLTETMTAAEFAAAMRAVTWDVTAAMRANGIPDGDPYIAEPDTEK